MNAPSKHAYQLPVLRQLLFAVLALSWLDTTMAQRWFLGIPDPGQPNLIHFRTPVPQDFVDKVMKQQSGAASAGKSYQRMVAGTEYSVLEHQIAWNPNVQQGNSVTFVTPNASGGSSVGGSWVAFSGNEWDGFKQTLARNSTQYGAGPWRQAHLMVMQIPGTGPADVTINLITPFVAGDSTSEQLGYAAMSPRIVAVAVGNGIAVGYQTEFDGKAEAAQVDMYRPGDRGRAWSVTLPLQKFGGLTTDGQNIYALSALNEDLGKELNTVTFRSGILNMLKLDSNGSKVWEKDLNNNEVMGSNFKVGMEGNAVYSPFTGGTAQLAYGNGQIAVVMACNTTPDLPIQSRHQRAVFFAVNADNGSGSASQSETSLRHSFDQRAIFDGLDFVFADIGDTGWYMPAAGITLRKGLPIDKKTSFAPDKIAEGVYVYARHGDMTATSNFSFTSLGDIVYDQKGYGVLFTSQKEIYAPPADGYQTPVQAPRQLAFVHVVESFDTVQDATSSASEAPVARLGNVQMDVGGKPERINITKNVVDSVGVNAGPYPHPTRSNTTFNQQGVVWLTQLGNGVSAERPKMVRLSNGAFLALWEEWTYQGTGQDLAYNETKAFLQGAGPRPARVINARLNPSGADRIFVRGDKANWITAGSDGRLTLNQVDSDLNLSSIILGEDALPDETGPSIPSRARDTQQPRPKMAQATPPSAANQTKSTYKEGDPRVTIYVTNKTGQPLAIYWVDGFGEEKSPPGTIPAGAEKLELGFSYPGNLFRFKINGELRHTWVIEKDQPHLTIQ